MECNWRLHWGQAVQYRKLDGVCLCLCVSASMCVSCTKNSFEWTQVQTVGNSHNGKQMPDDVFDGPVSTQDKGCSG